MSGTHIGESDSYHDLQGGGSRQTLTKGFNAGSSTNILGVRPGTGMGQGPAASHSKEQWAAMNATRAMEESVAPEDRRAETIPGLTAFLRQEYFRRLGVYINKADKEFDHLCKFWKDNVSLTYKKLRDEKLQMKELMRQSGAGMDNIGALNKTGMGSSKQRGGAAAPKPELETGDNFVYNQYKKFGDQFEIDVYETIKKDLQDEHQKETIESMKHSKRIADMSSNKDKQDDLISMKRMLMVYCYGPALHKKLEDDYEKIQDGHNFEIKLYMGRTIPNDQAQNTFGKPGQDNVTPIRSICYDPSNKRPSTAASAGKKHKVHFPVPPTKKKTLDKDGKPHHLDARAREVAWHDYYDELSQFYLRMRELDPSTSMERPLRINIEQFYTDNEFDQRDKAAFESLYHAFAETRKNKGIIIRDAGDAHGVSCSEMSDFFSKENFIKRVLLHKFFICKSKIQRKATLTQHFNSLNSTEKARNFIDWDYTMNERKRKSGGRAQSGDKQSAKDILEQYEKKVNEAQNQLNHDAAQEQFVKSQTKKRKLQDSVLHGKSNKKESDMKEDRHRASKHDLEEEKEKYFSKLAQPKDKWAVGRELAVLAKQFPHDRVLQRMLAEEMKSNPTFRAPEEYDQYHLKEEEPKRINSKRLVKNEEKLAKDVEYGEGKLQDFRTEDRHKKQVQMSENHNKRQANKKFEEALIKEAVDYLEKVVEIRKNVNKDKEAKALTVRNAVAKSHCKLYDHHQNVIEQRFGLDNQFGACKGKQLETVTKRDKDDKEYKAKQQSHHDRKYAYSQAFKRYFFRMVKAIGDSRRGNIGHKAIYMRMAKLPATFMIAGTTNTNNTRIIMNQALLKKGGRKDLDTHRTRAFYREDTKKNLKKIFMTQSDQDNCLFEPKCGSLKPISSSTPKDIASKITEANIKEALEKHGKNLMNTHPDVFKNGLLLQAKGKYNRGDYQGCMKIITENFHMKTVKQAAGIIELNPVEDAKPSQVRGQYDAFRKPEPEKKKAWWESQFDEPKPDDEKQKDDIGNKKVKAILQEVYELYAKLEKRKDEQKKVCKNLIQTTKELKHRAEYLSGKNMIQEQISHIDDKKKKLAEQHKHKGEGQFDQIEADDLLCLFKTIMCPLKDKCSRVQKIRWPYSSIKTIKRFGEQCPYAHHHMELEFPETLDARIKSLKNAKAKCAMNAKKEIQKPFIPASVVVYSQPTKQGEKPTVPLHVRYETEEMTMNAIKEVKAKKKDFTEKCERNLENQKGEYAKSINEKKKKLNDFKKSIDENKLRTQRANQLSEDYDKPEDAKNQSIFEMKGDENYVNKFGLLKKGCVLMSYGRYNDAFDALADAVKIVKAQKKIEEERNDLIKDRWIFKLGLEDGFELPTEIMNCHPDSKSDKELAEIIGSGTQCPVQTARILWENISPFKLAEGSKDTYLNMQIENAYLRARAQLQDKKVVLGNMKKKVDRLAELAGEMDEIDSNDEGGQDDAFDEDDLEAMKLKKKRRPTKLCPLLKNLKREGYNDKKYKAYLKTKSTKSSNAGFYGYGPMDLDIIPTAKGNPQAERANAQRLTLKLMKGDLGLKKDKGKEMEETEGTKANYFKKGQDIEFAGNQFPVSKNIYDQTSKNLSVVHTKQDRALRKNKTQKPFVPASRGGIEDLSVFAPYYPDQKNRQDEEGDTDKAPKSVWDIADPEVKPWAEEDAQ